MSFPSALSIAHRFDGHSWRDELCDTGFDVWGSDFYGFGCSDRYAEMSQPAEQNPPLGQAAEISQQIECAVRFICAQNAVPRISLIAHSGGTIGIAIFAIRNPELVDRLVFFAPIARRESTNNPAARFPAWRLISMKDQWERFTEEVPEGQPPVLSEEHFRDWGERYLETDPESSVRSPASVKTPTGIVHDITAAWQGKLAYDPVHVRAPSQSFAANGTACARMRPPDGCLTLYRAPFPDDSPLSLFLSHWRSSACFESTRVISISISRRKPSA